MGEKGKRVGRQINLELVQKEGTMGDKRGRRRKKQGESRVSWGTGSGRGWG